MVHALSLPAEEAVEGAGGRPDIIAGQDPRMGQFGQSVHQLKAHAVVSLFRHPDGDPDIGLRLGIGQDIPRRAQIAAVLLRHRELRHAAASHIIMAVEIRPVDERQAHIKMAVDEIPDGIVLTQAGKAVYYIRQWRNLR